VAKIYESQGQQVALRGPSRSAGFDPVQAFDPTQQILRSAEWELGLQRQDFKALTEFSDTLSKFLVDKTKEVNEQQKNLGIADILNGDVTINEDQMQQYREQAKILDQAADNEIAVSSELATVNPGAGETYRQQNPVVRGWRAYGQAIGKAQLAATQAEGILGTFLRSGQDPIQVRQADGSIKTFLPGEAESQPELMAAYAVGLQKFMTAAGITDINPAILVEHLTPTMLRVRAKLMGERMDEITRNRQANEREEINISAGQNLEGLGDPELGQRVLTTLLNDARKSFNGNWGAANEFVNEAVLGKLNALGRANPEKAEAILSKYSELLINPDKPELGTIYNRYAEDIEKTRASIQGSAKEQAAEQDAEVKKEIDTIYNTWRAASETGNLAQSQQAFDAAEQELSKLAATYPEATEALSRMRQQGRNANSLTEANVEQAVVNGSIKSRAELQLLAANKYISNDVADRLSAQLPEDDSEEMVKTLRPRLESFIRDQLSGTFSSQGLSFEAFRDKTLPLVGALTDELMEAGLNKMLELKAAGKTTGTAQLQSFLQKQALDALKTERFKVIKDAKGRAIIPTPGKGLPGVVPYSTGPNGRNYSQQIINRLPPVVSAKRDVLLDAEKVQANIDALNNGGQPSPDLVTIAKAANLPVRTVLAQQAQKNGITYTSASADVAAKKFQENSRLDPTAASILANPRSTAAQRIRATARLAEAKRRQAQASTPASGGKSFGAGDFGGLAALISSGEGGFNSINYGTTGSASQMNLTSMSIGQVLQKQESGQIGAAGFAQWVVVPGSRTSNLRGAMTAAGLSPNDKMTPENQLKMFWAYVLNTNKRPALRDYLLGKNNDLLTAHRELAYEWAAVKGPSGRGAYDNDSAGNMASIDAKRVQQALREARKQISGR
jgi:hypothetical protein